MAAGGAGKWWAAWMAVAGSWAVGFAAAFEWIVHNPMCNFLFRCGCVLNWRGGTFAQHSHLMRGVATGQEGRELGEPCGRGQAKEGGRCGADDGPGWNNCNVHNIEGPHCPFCESEGWYAWTTWVPATVFLGVVCWTCALLVPILCARWKTWRLQRAGAPSGDAAGGENSDRWEAWASSIDWEDERDTGRSGLCCDSAKKHISAVEKANSSGGSRWSLAVLNKQERLASCAVGIVLGSILGVATWGAAYTFVGFLFQQISGYPYFLWWGEE